MAKYTADNRFEIPDKTPVELPVGYKNPESLESMIARMIRVESVRAGQSGLETFEEADDFSDDEDGEIVSEYQFKDMQEEYYDRPVDRNGPRARERKGKDRERAEGDEKEKEKGSQSDSKEASEKRVEKDVDAQ